MEMHVLKILPVLGGGHAELTLELVAEGGGGEAHVFGNLREGHLRFLTEPTDRIFQAHGVNIGREGLPAGVGGQEVVHGATADVEAVQDILLLKGLVGVEFLFADDSVDEVEQFGVGGRCTGGFLSFGLLIDHSHQGAVFLVDYVLLTGEEERNPGSNNHDNKDNDNLDHSGYNF